VVLGRTAEIPRRADRQAVGAGSSAFRRAPDPSLPIDAVLLMRDNLSPRPYPRQTRGQTGVGVHRELRVSDTERQVVARRLERAVRDGRLTVVEFDQRLQAAYTARTRVELDDLTADLPPDLW
jgi:hypothetical protein